MTPLEIFEYKIKWMPNCKHVVVTDEFIDLSAKSWCRKNLQPHKWGFIKYTDFFEDTFCFEDEADKIKFEEECLQTWN